MNTIQRITTAVVTAAAAALLAAPASAIELTNGWVVNGTAFLNASAVDVEGNAAASSRNSGFHYSRGYLMFEGPLDGGYKARLTLDQRNDAGPAGATSTETVFIKHLYVEKSLSDALTVQVGQNATPMAGFDEKNMWGYRFIRNTFVDFWGINSTTDLGVSALGKVADGKLDYHASVMNGEGYERQPQGRSVSVAARVGLHLTPELQLGGWVQKEANRDAQAGNDPMYQLVYVAFDQPHFAVSGQLLLKATDGNNSPAGSAYNKGDGLNVQGRFDISGQGKTWVLARYDAVDPSNVAPKEKLLILGVSHQLTRNITIAPNIQQYDDGTVVNSKTTSYNVHAQVTF
ncbi:MAG: hypothetical protein OEW11_05175 [Nitrospirota bacterium]|nr:hypothetical protein [Nitrospirota bacterium]